MSVRSRRKCKLNNISDLITKHERAENASNQPTKYDRLEQKSQVNRNNDLLH